MVGDFSNARSQLQQLAQLPSDWDASGCSKYSTRHISHARYLLSILPAPPQIYPNPGKSILFSYGNSGTKIMELELFEDSSVRAFYMDKNGSYAYKMIDLHKAPKYLSNFYLEVNNESRTG